MQPSRKRSQSELRAIFSKVNRRYRLTGPSTRARQNRANLYAAGTGLGVASYLLARNKSQLLRALVSKHPGVPMTTGKGNWWSTDMMPTRKQMGLMHLPLFRKWAGVRNQANIDPRIDITPASRSQPSIGAGKRTYPIRQMAVEVPGDETKYLHPKMKQIGEITDRKVFGVKGVPGLTRKLSHWWAGQRVKRPESLQAMPGANLGIRRDIVAEWVSNRNIYNLLGGNRVYNAVTTLEETIRRAGHKGISYGRDLITKPQIPKQAVEKGIKEYQLRNKGKLKEAYNRINLHARTQPSFLINNDERGLRRDVNRIFKNYVKNAVKIDLEPQFPSISEKLSGRVFDPALAWVKRKNDALNNWAKTLGKKHNFPIDDDDGAYAGPPATP